MINRVVISSAEIMGVTPVFPDTRVPVQILLDYIEAGDSIDDFLEGFPTVTRPQVVAFLSRAAKLAVTEAVGGYYSTNVLISADREDRSRQRSRRTCS